MQSAPKRRRLFFDSVLIDAGKCVLRHRPNARENVTLISKRIVAAPDYLHDRAHGWGLAIGRKYRRFERMPP
jgi:hypothetical protein